MSDRTTKALVNQYKAAPRRLMPGITARCKEGDVRTWYILIKGIDKPEFAGGEYLYKIVACDGFPDKAPACYAITPNGIWLAGAGKFCMGGGSTDFHQSAWTATTGMYGMANNILSTMINWKDIIPAGVVGFCGHQTSDAEKVKMATESTTFNAQHATDIMKLFDS